jgi:hypothetical protein
MKTIKNFFLRIKYKLPKYYKDVWYNQSLHMSKIEYPVVFNENDKYIYPKKGLLVLMEVKDGYYFYYKIINITRSKGSCWLYDTDPINCTLKFADIKMSKIT